MLENMVRWLGRKVYKIIMDIWFKDTQEKTDVAPEVMECANPVELNCEKVALLRQVQENKV